MTCKQCGSHAINHHSHGRDGSDSDLCDVCYWRKRAERVQLTPGHAGHLAREVGYDPDPDSDSDSEYEAMIFVAGIRAAEHYHGITRRTEWVPDAS